MRSVCLPVHPEQNSCIPFSATRPSVYRILHRGMDIVYNYGTFDDTDPLFYIHFTQGIMNYSLSAETMYAFMMEYTYEHRAVFDRC